MFDALAGDVAELQGDDRLGKMAADIAGARADRCRCAGGQAAVSFHRVGAGGELRRDALHRGCVALDEFVCAGACRLQMLAGGCEFLGKLLQAATRRRGRVADFVGERQELGANRAYAGGYQPCVHCQHVDLVQRGSHSADPAVDRRDGIGEACQRGNRVTLRVGEGGDSCRRLCQVLPRLRQCGAAQLVEQAIECRCQPAEDADGLFQAAADFQEAALGHGSQGAECVCNLREAFGERQGYCFSCGQFAGTDFNIG